MNLLRKIKNRTRSALSYSKQRVSNFITNKASRVKSYVSNKASRTKKRISNLYTNASLLLYSNDQKKLHKAQIEYGNRYLIQLFLYNPKLVLLDLETMDDSKFKSLYSSFAFEYNKIFPDIGRHIKEVREISLRLKRYKRNLDDGNMNHEDYIRMYDKDEADLKQMNDELVDMVKSYMKNKKLKQMTAKVYKGKRPNGSRLFEQQGTVGSRILETIEPFVG